MPDRRSLWMSEPRRSCRSRRSSGQHRPDDHREKPVDPYRFHRRWCRRRSSRSNTCSLGGNGPLHRALGQLRHSRRPASRRTSALAPGNQLRFWQCGHPRRRNGCHHCPAGTVRLDCVDVHPATGPGCLPADLAVARRTAHVSSPSAVFGPTRDIDTTHLVLRDELTSGSQSLLHRATRHCWVKGKAVKAVVASAVRLSKGSGWWRRWSVAAAAAVAVVTVCVPFDSDNQPGGLGPADVIRPINAVNRSPTGSSARRRIRPGGLSREQQDDRYSPPGRLGELTNPGSGQCRRPGAIPRLLPDPGRRQTGRREHYAEGRDARRRSVWTNRMSAHGGDTRSLPSHPSAPGGPDHPGLGGLHRRAVNLLVPQVEKVGM